MKITAGRETLNRLICRQIDNNFLLDQEEKSLLLNKVPAALERCGTNFSANRNKYFSDPGGNAIFNPYHSGQYTTFLYFLSREVSSAGFSQLADKVYYLNRMMNGLDLFYEVALPNVFALDHPLGSILGRATYGNRFVFNQNCTVGGNHDVYPVLGDYVTLFANATVIGRCKIGNNVFISAGCYIKDEDIPDNTIVFGRSPNLILKQKPTEYFYRESPFKAHHDKPLGT